jgi:hypothetical protein
MLSSALFIDFAARFVQFMNSLNTFCMDNRPNYEPGESVAEGRELFESRSKIKVSVWPDN